jgi:hypothetical protein
MSNRYTSIVEGPPLVPAETLLGEVPDGAFFRTSESDPRLYMKVRDLGGDEVLAFDFFIDEPVTFRTERSVKVHYVTIRDDGPVGRSAE